MTEGFKLNGTPTPLQQRGQLIIDQLNGAAPPARRPGANPRIGVALGGGSARGLTHIPYIEALDELGLKPSVISLGASALPMKAPSPYTKFFPFDPALAA